MKYPELIDLKKANKVQDEIYQPSSFWDESSSEITKDLNLHGIENFRSIKSILSFFVPTYGAPSNSFQSEIIEEIDAFLKEKGTKKQSLAMTEFLSGYFHALSDYRVFAASDDKVKKPFLSDFSESNFGNPVEQFEFDGKKYSRSSLNYILGLCMLKKHLTKNDGIKNVLEIGGGFGTLGEILKYSNDIRYIDIDIPPVSFVAWKYLKNVYGDIQIEKFESLKEITNIDNLKLCSVFNSWEIEKIHGKIDLFVNFISFQEMEPHIVQNYLNHVKRLNPEWILLRNMREGKQLKTKESNVGVEKPIKKDDYINMIRDSYTLIESNVIPFGYKTVDGFNSELLLFKKKHE